MNSGAVRFGLAAGTILAFTACDQAGTATRSAELEGDPTSPELTGPPGTADMGGDGWVWVDADGAEVLGIGMLGEGFIYYDEEWDAVWLFEPDEEDPTRTFRPGAETWLGVSPTTGPCDDYQYGWTNAPFVNMVGGPGGGPFRVVKSGATLTYQIVMFRPLNDVDTCQPLDEGWVAPVEDFHNEIPLPSITWRLPLRLEYSP